MYCDTYRIVRQISRCVSYRQVTIVAALLQMPAVLAREYLVNRRDLVTNVRVKRTLLCVGCLNPTTHEYQVRVASGLISVYIFILKISKIHNLTKRKRKRKAAKLSDLSKD